MKRHWAWTVAVTVAFVLTFSPLAQGGLFSSRVDKARDFAKANMIDKAVEVLNQEIEENPTNAEAHYELGSIYLNQGNFGQAEARFKGAVGLDGKYKERVSQKYMDTGNAMMNRGKEQEARRYFDAAISIQPNLRQKIADDFMRSAQAKMERGDFNGAFRGFETAAYYQPGLRSKIGEICLQKASQLPASSSMEFYKKMLAYDPGLKGQVVKSLKDRSQNSDPGEFEGLIKQNFDENVGNAIYGGNWPWKEVYRKTFTGVGYTGGDFPEYNDGGIKIFKAGENILANDRFTVINNDFETWHEGGWKKFKAGHWIIAKTIQIGAFQVIRGQEGEKYTVVIERR